MDILIGLIVISLFIASGFLVIFLWNLRTGQYDDTVTPAIRILFDDTVRTSDPPPAPQDVPDDKDQAGR